MDTNTRHSKKRLPIAEGIALFNSVMGWNNNSENNPLSKIYPWMLPFVQYGSKVCFIWKFWCSLLHVLQCLLSQQFMFLLHNEEERENWISAIKKLIPKGEAEVTSHMIVM